MKTQILTILSIVIVLTIGYIAGRIPTNSLDAYITLNLEDGKQYIFDVPSEFTQNNGDIMKCVIHNDTISFEIVDNRLK